MSRKPYGSGYFGEWIEDEFGLPAYRYTCDQINDPKAVSPVNEAFRSKTDHSFLIGNDRLVGVASNYGFIQVRQDEGGPKFLNDYDPKNNIFAGGFGYLTDGNIVISTYFTGSHENFERIYGVGYFRKKVEENGLIIDQIIFAPFGDDPILISQIFVSNARKEPSELRWVEYWDCTMHQFSYDDFLDSLSNKNISQLAESRRRFSAQFKHKFNIIFNGKGLQEIKFIEQSSLNENKKNGRKKPEYKDKTPPPTFLVSLDAHFDSKFTNGPKFFGSGGIRAPDGLKMAFNTEDSFSDEDNSMFLERKLYLKPGESKTIYFAYGYIPDGYELTSLINKYNKNLSSLFSESCKRWQENRIKLKIPDDSWVDRELMWHYSYLRGAMTYDDFFDEHILSQGHVYQYIIGFQGAARDPLQHAMPFLFCQPEIVKEVIRYILKTVDKNGEIPYGICGNGKIQPTPFKPSDLELWLLWLASEYVLITRDTNFLNEEILTYPIYGKKASKAIVRELLLLCYKRFINITGVGKHGLQRLSNGDWNDGVVVGHVPVEKHMEVRKVAETVLNSAMATYVLVNYAEMLNFYGDNDTAGEALEYANSLRNAILKQWTGRWFKRAWLTEDIGWIGEKQMWLEPQPWAILGGCPDQDQTKILVDNINELVRKTSKTGAMIMSEPLSALSSKPGIGLNCGIWPSINGTLIMALARIDHNMAWDEWKKNTLAMHAEQYPEVWYGIWSGPDTYNSELSSYPGQTGFDDSLLSDTSKEDDIRKLTRGLNWTDFPVLNLHPHAWPLYNIIHLIGAEFTKEGLKLTPILPKEEYQFISPILGFEKSKNGYSGWYAPKVEGNWKITLELNQEEIQELNFIEINDKEDKLITNDNKIIFEGKSSPNSPLKWKLTKESY